MADYTDSYDDDNNNDMYQNDDQNDDQQSDTSTLEIGLEDTEATEFEPQYNLSSENTGDESPFKGGRYHGGSCGTGAYVGGSLMSKAARLLSSDLVKALLVVLVIMLLFSLYHYSKNKMQMRKYGMPALRRRFPNFSSSRP